MIAFAVLHYGGLNEVSEGVTGRKIHAEQEGSTPMRDFNDSVMDLKRTRRPIQAHDHAPVTVPKINGYGAPVEACQHLNGCSCQSRFTANLGS